MRRGRAALARKTRGSSVFPAPIRAVLPAASYEEACRLGQAADGRKISKQTYNILPKIRETDELLRNEADLRADLRSVVHEVHPEVSFSLLAGGRPLQSSKRKHQGIRQRCALLEPKFGSWLAAALSKRKILGCTDDDIVDAYVALWTAERIARGEAQKIPQTAAKRSVWIDHGDRGVTRSL